MKKIRAVLASIGLTALVGVGALATAANATDSNEGWHTWATTNTSEPTSSTVHWPQSYVGKGQLAPDCGVWYQQDLYKETDSKKDASIADVIEDGVLTNGEDHHIVQEWRFVYGGDCPPEKPEPETGVDKTSDYVCVDPANGTGVTTTTTTRWTQDYVLVDGEWVLGAKEYEEPVTNTKVSVDEDCIPVQPETIEGEAVTAVYICTDPADGTGTTTTTTTTWTQGHSWDQDAGVWVLDDKVYGDPVTTTAVTDDPACIPDAPESKSGTDSESYDYCTEPSDGTRTYVMTETAWTQTSVWDQEAGQWILGEKVYGEPFENETVVADSECDVPEEEPETPTAGEAPPATPAPAATPVVAEATYTG